MPGYKNLGHKQSSLLDRLTDHYENFNKREGLKLGSADEHVHDEKLTPNQRSHVRRFSKTWEKAESRDTSRYIKEQK